MTSAYKQKLQEWFAEDRGLFTRPMASSEILSQEQDIGLRFSKGYREFLKGYGSGIVDAYGIHGNPQDNFIGGYFESVAEKTKYYKEVRKWPGIDDWYVISDDGSGNPIGIDPAGVVWLSPQDTGFKKLKLADNFEEFLYKLLTDTLYESEEGASHD